MINQVSERHILECGVGVGVWVGVGVGRKIKCSADEFEASLLRAFHIRSQSLSYEVNKITLITYVPGWGGQGHRCGCVRGGDPMCAQMVRAHGGSRDSGVDMALYAGGNGRLCGREPAPAGR